MLPHVDIHGWGDDYWRLGGEIERGEKIFGDAVREFSRMSAVAGAISSRSMRWATAMCSMALSTLAGAEPAVAKMSVITFVRLAQQRLAG